MSALVALQAMIATGIGLDEAIRAFAGGHPTAALTWFLGSLAMFCAGIAVAYVKGEQT
jgi:hypothetical protein